jgi:hypothetical protein
MKIVQLKAGNLDGPHPETSQQRQDGKISKPMGPGTVATLQEGFNLGRCQPGRQLGLPPAGNWREGGRQWCRSQAFQVQEAQEWPEPSNQVLCAPANRTRRFPKDERRDIGNS